MTLPKSDDPPDTHTLWPVSAHDVLARWWIQLKGDFSRDDALAIASPLQDPDHLCEEWLEGHLSKGLLQRVGPDLYQKVPNPPQAPSTTPPPHGSGTAQAYNDGGTAQAGLSTQSSAEPQKSSQDQATSGEANRDQPDEVITRLAYQPWSAKDFLARKLPAKEILVEGLLYRRDMVTLAGRRRHGKTTFTLNLAVALTHGHTEFLGYSIPQTCRVLAFFLEDDIGEIQEKLRRTLNGVEANGSLALLTREDFLRCKIPVDASDKNFGSTIMQTCKHHRPDVVILDNLSMLVRGDYNDAKKIDTLMQLVWELASKFDCAVITSAHPRKRSKETLKLRDDSEAFFEETMGSSHLINSTGSLWGLERDLTTNKTTFLGGAQRWTGKQTIASLIKGEGEWFEVLDDVNENALLILNTEKRWRAWNLLPEHAVRRCDAEKAVEPALRRSAFDDWWKDLVRVKLMVPEGDTTFRKAKLSISCTALVNVGAA